jgi:hypothetical protein
VYDVQVGLDEVEIQTGDTIQVEVGLDDVEVQTENSGIVDVEPHEYYLTSSGIYTGRLTGSVPAWLQNAIQQELTLGEGNLTNLVNDIRSLVTVLEVGVNQNVTSIQTTNQSLAALETSVVSRLDTNEAAILNVETTKVTSDEAQTVALELQRSTFGTDAEAYITSVAATYTDNDSAVAQDIDLLVATVDGVTASVTQLSTVSVDEGEARAKHSLVVNADNNISGYVAEAGTTSTFTILADQFKVANATTNFPVFVVDTTPGDEHVQFNSNVRIDGNLIVENTITATQIAANTITATQIAADTITASQIATNTITASEIASNAITANEIAASTITTSLIDTENFNLPTNGGLVSGTTIGAFTPTNVNQVKYITSIGTGAGFYLGHIRMVGGTDHVKTIYFQFRAGTSITSPLIYQTPTTAVMQGHVDRLYSSSDSANLPVSFKYTGTSIVGCFIYAQADSAPDYVGSVDVQFLKFGAA